MKGGSALTDQELVTAFQKGDMAAFDTLYERYRDDAYRTACLITGNRMDGEDLTQEAFVQCARSIGSLRDGEKFRSWLLRLITRAAWKFCAKRQREQPVGEFFEVGESESALSCVLRTEEQRRLYKALLALDEKQRTAVVLYYFSELSISEIAHVTGTFSGTVKSRLHAARNNLRKALDETTIQTPKEVIS